MIDLLNKYTEKLVKHGLCDAEAPLFAGLDDGYVWNRKGEKSQLIIDVMTGLGATYLLFSRPAEPYFSIINRISYDAIASGKPVRPDDSETRLFLHDIPVLENFSAAEIINHLKKRKAVIVKDQGIITHGSISPEQAFITFSSVCFSCYVKFFTDCWYGMKNGNLDFNLLRTALEKYETFLSDLDKNPPLAEGPFSGPDSVVKAMSEAGRLMVDSRMVDSFFGNISYRQNDRIFISQTGSSLDELEKNIDECPLDNSRTSAITASSEFSSHKSIFEKTDSLAILHGHPRFSVIISMICDEASCPDRGECFRACRKKRFINDIPIVPGEVGTGPTGISTTLPPAIIGKRGAIVYGHGLFCRGAKDFKDAYSTLFDVERMCLDEYKRITGL